MLQTKIMFYSSRMVSLEVMLVGWLVVVGCLFSIQNPGKSESVVNLPTWRGINEGLKIHGGHLRCES